jgi:uncharacterized membrane protein YbhN (UPF0104 family)
MRAGEASFPILLQRKFSISLAKSTSALVSFRLLDLIVLTLLGVITLLVGLHQAGHLQLLTIVFLTSVAVLLLLPKSLRALTRHRPNLQLLISKINQGLPEWPGEIIYLAIWTFIIWTTKLIAYALILQIFIDSDLSLSLVAAVSGELASGIPLYTPAAIGTFEAGITAALLPAGIDQSSAISAALNLHLFLLITTSISALLGLLIGNRPYDSR